ncbi:MAG: prepilin peptidase [Candidatus Saccharimonadales bacterium]
MDKRMILIAAILGLALGSFINAFVWRINKQYELYRQVTKKRYSILTGRSMCPSCEHQLGMLDLIPVASWLFLRGKCRYCRKPISFMYPLVELSTTGLFILSYIYWPNAFNAQGITDFVLWLTMLAMLVSLVVYDIKWLTLPNKIIYPLLGLVLIQLLIQVLFFSNSYHWLYGNILGLLIGGGVFYVLFQFTKGKWIGGGDVKLGSILGLYLGSGWLAILMIFFASLAGILYSLPLLAKGKVKRNTLIPYGPFLILAAIILRLFGGTIISWLNTKGIVLN